MCHGAYIRRETRVADEMGSKGGSSREARARLAASRAPQAGVLSSLARPASYSAGIGAIARRARSSRESEAPARSKARRARMSGLHKHQVIGRRATARTG